MIEARGTVTALEGDCAFVRTESEGCGRCHEPGGCGGAHLTRAFCSSPKVYRVLNPSGAKPGDEVTLVIHDRAVLRGAIAGYVLPLLGLFLGAALGLRLAGDAGSIGGAVCGLAAAWGLQKTRLARKVFPGPDSEPRIKS